MDEWELKAAKKINEARSLVRGEQTRLYREVNASQGRAYRQGELEELLDILTQAKDHIDPHCAVPWEYQTPLPF